MFWSFRTVSHSDVFKIRILRAGLNDVARRHGERQSAGRLAWLRVGVWRVDRGSGGSGEGWIFIWMPYPIPNTFRICFLVSDGKSAPNTQLQ
jgi:hypothetical protein